MYLACKRPWVLPSATASDRLTIYEVPGSTVQVCRRPDEASVLSPTDTQWTVYRSHTEPAESPGLMSKHCGSSEKALQASRQLAVLSTSAQILHFSILQTAQCIHPALSHSPQSSLVPAVSYGLFSCPPLGHLCHQALLCAQVSVASGTI